MNHIEKFISKLNPADRLKILKIIESIKAGAKRGKRLTGLKGLMSMRIGKIRIIYSGSGENFKIHDIDWRDKIYKKLQ